MEAFKGVVAMQYSQNSLFSNYFDLTKMMCYLGCFQYTNIDVRIEYKPKDKSERK
jgi:hypothetical protein